MGQCQFAEIRCPSCNRKYELCYGPQLGLPSIMNCQSCSTPFNPQELIDAANGTRKKEEHDRKTND